MTTQNKLLSGFAAVFALGLILGICGLIATNALTNLSEEQYELQNTSSSVANVLNAHYLWRQSITEAVLKGAEFTGSVNPDTCALGSWRQGDQAKKITDQQLLSLLSQIDTPHAYIHNQAKIVSELLKAGDQAGAERELVDNILPQTEMVITALASMESRCATLLEEKGNEILKTGNSITILIISLLLIAAVLCILLVWKLTSIIMKPIREMAKTAETLSVGDLDVQITYSVRDEIGQLADAFRNLIEGTQKQVAVAESLANGDLTVEVAQRSEKDVMNFALNKMSQNLNSLFGEVRSASEQVSSGANQVSQGAQGLATGSTQQAASIEEFSATLTEMQEKTHHSAENSNKAREANSNTTIKLEDSIRSMNEMLDAMKSIDESSSSITKVIKVIDDIAFQTNILALNAAVEAARAGQHGKGFAVVADEVRNLAAKSAEAAKETSALIEGSSSRVREGNQIVAKTSTDLEAAAESARESTHLIDQVAIESIDQAKAIEEINNGISHISSVVQANSATAEQSAAAAEEMSAQAAVMNQIVERFKLRQSGNSVSRGYSAQRTEAPRRESTGFALSGGKY